jgi:hypothetical protein
LVSVFHAPVGGTAGEYDVFCEESVSELVGARKFFSVWKIKDKIKRRSGSLGLRVSG